MRLGHERGELRKLTAIGLRSADPRPEQVVQQLAGAPRTSKFGGRTGVDRGGRRQEATALAPLPQVHWRLQHVIAGRILIVGGVDEVQRDVTTHQWKVSGSEHVDDGTSEVSFSGTLGTNERCFAGTKNVWAAWQVVIFGALIAAIGWGISDYAGGDAARRDAPVFAIVAISQVLGVVLLIPALVAHGDQIAPDPRFLFAVLAGFSVTFELSLIYRALSRGSALINAPVAALGAVVAVVIGLVGGDALSPLIVVGLVCALAGSGMGTWSSAEQSKVHTWRGGDRAISLAAAVSVGVTLTLLHRAGPLNAYWVTAVQHASTAASSALIAAVAARPPGARRSARGAQNPLMSSRRFLGVMLIAVAGTAGDVGYVSASHRGALSIVAALASLYPVATITLGRVLRGHQASRVQLLGVAVALTGGLLLGASTQ